MYTANTIFPSVVISDAFEAVTNGMQNTEVFEQLESLDSNELNNSWRSLIYAIQAFYQRDFGSMNKCLSEIQEGSKPSLCKKILYRMAGYETSTDKLSVHEEKLLKEVTENSIFIKSAAAELKESIGYGEVIFTETAALLINEIRSDEPEAAARLALWSLRTCIENGFDEESLVDSILLLFGQAEGLRLLGLSLIESDPESALICLTRSLIKKLSQKKTDSYEVSAWLEIIIALLEAVPETGTVFIDVSELFSMLESEIRLYFDVSITENSGDLRERAGILCRAVKNSDIELIKEKYNIENITAIKKEAVQLELF